MGDIVVRPVRGHEWIEVRALRLRALQDEAAGIAFVDTLEAATVRPDEFWKDRTAQASSDAGPDPSARQFVATTSDGNWIGSITVLIERAGEKDFEGKEIRRSGGGVVGVYLDPAYRGKGVIQSLFDAAFDWLRDLHLDSARLYVHAENSRAHNAYLKAGFRPTGVTLVGSIGPEVEMARAV